MGDQEARPVSLASDFRPASVMPKLFIELDKLLRRASEDARLRGEAFAPCECLDLDFGVSGGGQEVGYSERIRRLVYLLRYLYGYGAEYRLLYRDLLGLIGEARVLDVVSIGCGNGIDYWSLLQEMAAEPAGGWDASTPVNYHGLDVEDWSDVAVQLRALDCSEACLSGTAYSAYHWADAGALLKEQADAGKMCADVFLFPKSILEIRACDEAWGDVISAFERAHGSDRARNREFYLAISRPQSLYCREMYECDEGGELRSAVDDLLSAVCRDGRYVAELACAASDRWRAEGLDAEQGRPLRIGDACDADGVPYGFGPYLSDRANWMWSKLVRIHECCGHLCGEKCCNPQVEGSPVRCRQYGLDVRVECVRVDRSPLVNYGYAGYEIYRCAPKATL